MNTPQFRDFGQAPKIVNAVGEATDGFMKSFMAYQQKKQKMRDEEDLSAALTDLQKQAVEFQSNWKGTHFGTEARDAGKVFSQNVDETAIKMIDERFKGRDELAARFRAHAAQISFSGFSHGTQYDDQQDMEYRKTTLDAQREGISAIIANGTEEDVQRAVEGYRTTRDVFFPGKNFADDDFKLERSVNMGFISKDIASGNLPGARARIEAARRSGIFTVEDLEKIQGHYERSVVDQINLAGENGDLAGMRRIAAENGYRGNVQGRSSGSSVPGFHPDIEAKVRAEAERQGVDPILALAVAMQESSGKHTRRGRDGVERPLVSSAGAVGLMQIMPQFVDEFGGGDVNNLDDNIRLGVTELKKRLEQSGGNVEEALLRYNWGPGNVDAWKKTGKGVKGQVMPKEAMEYASKVLGRISGGSSNMSPFEIKMHGAVTSQMKKNEARIMEGYRAAEELAKFGDLSQMRDMSRNLRAAGFTERADQFDSVIKAYEKTSEDRRWASSANMGDLQARLRELEWQMDPEHASMPHENLTASKGILRQGNIDIHARPKVQLADGSTATVRSIAVTFDDGTFVIPTIGPKGEDWSNEQAIEEFKRTGKHLGMFKTAEDAEAYSIALHENQDKEYLGGDKKTLDEYTRISAQYKAVADVYKARKASYDKDPAAAADAELVDVSQGASPEAKVQARLDRQKANGVVSPVPLTKTEVDGLGAEYENTNTPAAFIKMINNDYGKQAPAVMAQLVHAKKIPQAVNLIADMDPASGGVLARTSKGTWVKDTETARGMKPIDRESIKTIISGEMEDILETITKQGDPATANAVIDGAYGMALYYIGQGMSEKDAARRASDEILKSRYSVQDGYRIPIRFDADQIRKGVDLAQSATSGDVEGMAIIVQKDSGLSDEQLRYRKEKIIRGGYWINNSDESGLILCVSEGVPVRRKTGEIVQYTFDELLTLGKED